MRSLTLTLSAIIASVALVSSPAAMSQSGLNLDDKMKQACADKDEGDVCDFSNDKGESINGQCKRSGSSSDSLLRCMATN